jgi:hypothetical protein
MYNEQGDTLKKNVVHVLRYDHENSLQTQKTKGILGSKSFRTLHPCFHTLGSIP